MGRETQIPDWKFLGATLLDPRVGSLAKYRSLVLGSGGILALLGYELRMLLLGNIPGALGILLRRLFYRRMFRKMGRGVIIGTGVTFRHPGRISLGDHVALDDYSTLDARGEKGGGIALGDRTIVSRFAILRTKEGTITIGRGGGIGSHSILASTSTLEAGENLLLAPCVCVLAGGQHAFDRADVPVVAQGMVSKGGISIGDDVWIGTRATVLDGVRIGGHAVIGACALVNKDIPGYAVAYGIPAKPVRDRREIPNPKSQIPKEAESEPDKGNGEPA
ncbi:MAG: acyltransferase [Chlamydiota bacterium]